MADYNILFGEYNTQARHYADLARKAHAGGQETKAIENIVMAVLADPSDKTYKQEFVSLANLKKFHVFAPELKQAVLHCLETEGLYHDALTYPWTSLLQLDPSFPKEVFSQDYDGFCRMIAKESAGFLQDPYLTAGLRRLIVPDPEFENFIIHLRRAFLEGRLPAGKHPGLLAALGIYFHYTTYIQDVAPEEEEKIEILKKRASGKSTKEADIQMLACYRALHELENRADIAAAFRDKPFTGELVRVQIEEPAQEQEIAAAIPSLTKIEDDVSKKVRAQYEEYPYPRWKSLPGHGVLPWIKECREILIAGCGTGQEALYFARMAPDAFVLAVDLSRASLAYGIRKTWEFDFGNIDFRQADILELAGTGKKFDLISASGVLHHMDAPQKGWEVLAGMLKPGGRMHVGLYSQSGRKNIIAAQQAFAGKGYPPTREGIRAFRREFKNLLTPEQYAAFIHSPEFYSFSSCRDFLSHAQERCFALPEIEAMMKDLNLELITMDVPAMYVGAYRHDFPHDPDMKDFSSLHAFEQKNPATFQAMYALWCRKKN